VIRSLTTLAALLLVASGAYAQAAAAQSSASASGPAAAPPAIQPPLVPQAVAAPQAVAPPVQYIAPLQQLAVQAAPPAVLTAPVVQQAPAVQYVAPAVQSFAAPAAPMLAAQSAFSSSVYQQQSFAAPAVQSFAAPSPVCSSASFAAPSRFAAYPPSFRSPPALRFEQQRGRQRTSLELSDLSAAPSLSFDSRRRIGSPFSLFSGRSRTRLSLSGGGW
jgi:hypothetical protein